MTCAGVDRHVAAEILGLSVASYRTLRTRLGVPPVANKTAFNGVFDREVGEETIKRATLEIVASIRRHDDRPPQFFWRFRDERQVRLAPNERPQRSRGDTSFAKPIVVVTRTVLDAEIRNCGGTPASGATVIHPLASQAVDARQNLHLVPPRPEKAPLMPPAPASRAPFATARASVGM